MAEFVVDPLVVPSSLDDSDAADFIEYVELVNLALARALGSNVFDRLAAEELPVWRIPGQFVEGYVVRIDGKIVGAATYSGTESGDTHVDVIIDPSSRRRGIGSALFARVTERARTDGRLTLKSEFVDSMPQGETVDAASGVGSVSADNPGLAFALAQGATLEQVARASVVTLPVDEAVAAAREAEARDAYAGAYELVRWEGRTPEHYLDDIAVLITRMSTDQPTAGLEQAEDVWDAERVRGMEEQFATSPRRQLTAAARELATGRLVGYTQLSVPAETGRAVNQWATLVLREHRGHRLGLALKLENLRHLEAVSPGHPSVLTVNAAENKPMLDVNESVGFVAIGCTGVVQLKLDV
jgi:GNAT superfamily N-acetyltransferase